MILREGHMLQGSCKHYYNVMSYWGK